MEVTFVGSGDAFGSGGRFQTCLRLGYDGGVALVDCGATSLTALRAQGSDPQQVDTVVLTHLHGDHFGGLPFLVLDGQFSRRTMPLTVLGPVGNGQRLPAAMEASYPGSAGVRRRFTFDVLELPGEGGAVESGPLTVGSWQVEHPSGAPALAVSVRAAGRTFGYSGDTAWTSALLRAAEGTDAFACEAYTYDRPVPYHVDYADVRDNAPRLDTRRLVLTHMGPGMLARLDEIPEGTGYDGLSLRL